MNLDGSEQTFSTDNCLLCLASTIKANRPLPKSQLPKTIDHMCTRNFSPLDRFQDLPATTIGLVDYHVLSLFLFG